MQTDIIVATRRLAIIGGGPRATYVLERLSMTLERLGPGEHLEVYVFEKTGEFGAGRVHSPHQSPVSILNRTADQVSFCADEGMGAVGSLREPWERATLLEWALQRGLGPSDGFPTGKWLPRRIHGLALADFFAAHAERIRAHPQATLRLIADEVTDLQAHPGDPKREVVVETARGEQVIVDQVLLVTGHMTPDPKRMAGQAVAAERTSKGAVPLYVPEAYPLDSTLNEQNVPPGSTLGIRGAGLVALDIVFHLTAGRGGHFVEEGAGSVRYVPSGREPAQLVLFSRSGLLPYARPADLGETTGFVSRGAGRFFTPDAVARLRRATATPDRSLDFDRQVLPVMVLEMAYQHYGALFGPAAAEWLAAQVDAAAADFVEAPLLTVSSLGADDGGSPDIECLARLLEPAVERLATMVARVTGRGRAAGEEPFPVPDSALVSAAADHWLGIVDPGNTAGDEVMSCSSTGLVDDPHANRFSWAALCTPYTEAPRGSDQSIQDLVIDALERDVLRARHGARANPYKAAANGVWRELRSLLSSVVDDGGLTAASHRRFLEVHLRHHNRFANGAAPQALACLIALARQGIVRLDVGPGAKVEPHEAFFGIRADNLAEPAHVDALVEGWIPSFDPDVDRGSLYRNLLRRGLASRWTHPASSEPKGHAAGMHVDARNRSIGRYGTEPRLTILGPPLEGQKSFQISALRPGQDQAVMTEIVAWLEDFWAVPPRLVSPLQPAPTGPSQ